MSAETSMRYESVDGVNFTHLHRREVVISKSTPTNRCKCLCFYLLTFFYENASEGVKMISGNPVPSMTLTIFVPANRGNFMHSLSFNKNRELKCTISEKSVSLWHLSIFVLPHPQTIIRPSFKICTFCNYFLSDVISRLKIVNKIPICILYVKNIIIIVFIHVKNDSRRPKSKRELTDLIAMFME